MLHGPNLKPKDLLSVNAVKIYTEFVLRPKNRSDLFILHSYTSFSPGRWRHPMPVLPGLVLWRVLYVNNLPPTPHLPFDFSS